VKRTVRLSVSILMVVTLLMSLSLVGSAKTTENWNDIVKAANKEGKVVVYSTTSRIMAAAEAFEQKTGIKVEAHRLSETELIERVYREARAGIKSVDLVLIEDFPSMKELLVAPGYLVNYIPPSARKAVPETMHNPLVFAHVSRVIGYNSEKYKTAPFESIWDLTTPQWKGKVMIRDLALTGEHQNAFTELIRRSDELAADYEKRFGKKLELREDNAGLEFLRRLSENDIIIMTSDTRIAEAVGKKGQEDPPVGFFYVYSKHRDAEAKNLAIKAAVDLKPFAGYYYDMYLQLSSKPAHPNAAKLFADYLMSPEGFTPWSSDIGIYASNGDIEHHPQDMPWKWWESRLWTYDPDFAIQNRGIVLDAWIRSVSK
jgi:iron(III) transport system substrate-binding protein